MVLFAPPFEDELEEDDDAGVADDDVVELDEADDELSADFELPESDEAAGLESDFSALTFPERESVR